MAEEADWAKLTRSVKWRKRTLAAGELITKMVRGIDWEDVAFFVGIMTALVLVFCLVLAGIHASSHGNDVRAHRLEIQVQACKSAVNVDACLARLQ